MDFNRYASAISLNIQSMPFFAERKDVEIFANVTKDHSEIAIYVVLLQKLPLPLIGIDVFKGWSWLIYFKDKLIYIYTYTIYIYTIYIHNIIYIYIYNIYTIYIQYIYNIYTIYIYNIYIHIYIYTYIQYKYTYIYIQYIYIQYIYNIDLYIQYIIIYILNVLYINKLINK